jgi:hydrogenase maturation protein HypF
MWETGHSFMPAIEGATLVAHAWSKGIGTSPTSSVGRLFDAAASLVLGVDVASFEGQGPMMLESAAADGCDAIPLPLTLDNGILRMDWAPLLPMLTDRDVTAEMRAGIFHESLACALAEQAINLMKTDNLQAVGLTGGAFQNRLLAERVIDLLAARDITVYVPEVVPVNDGGLAFGQLIEALYMDRSQNSPKETSTS